MFSRRVLVSLALGSTLALFGAMVWVNAKLSWRPVSIPFPPGATDEATQYVPLFWHKNELVLLADLELGVLANQHVHGAQRYKIARSWNRAPLPIGLSSPSRSGVDAFSPASELWALARYSHPKIHLWRGNKGAGTLRESGHRNSSNTMQPGPITLLSFSPDGKRLAASSHLYGYGDHQENLRGFCNLGLVLFDTQSGKQIARQNAVEGAFAAVAWAPNSSEVAGITLDGWVFVLNAQSGKLRLKFRAHNLFGACIAWSPDGKTLVTASNPRVGLSPTRLTFDLKSGTGFSMGGGGGGRTTIGEGENKTVIAHTANGDATWNGRTERLLYRFDAQTGKQIGIASPLQTGAVEIAFSPDGTRLAIGQHEFVLILSAQTFNVERRLVVPNPPPAGSVSSPVCVAWSEDGATLAASTARGLTLWRMR